MDRRFYSNPFVSDQEERDGATPESCPNSPNSGDETRVMEEPSPKKSKKGLHKRVISVPIGDVDGSKSKGEVYPPSDSWAWRKYGQKPIKGSPYPRGYYRCSSSKGCPARKQVERSRVDPTKIVITYACEHNHPLPTAKHHHHHHYSAAAATKKSSSPPGKTPSRREQERDQEQEEQETEQQEQQQQHQEQEQEQNSGMFGWGNEDSLLTTEFGWFDDMASTSVYAGPASIYTSFSNRVKYSEGSDVAMGFTSMREEDESLFADLGELPEYSMVFRHVEPEEQNRRCSLSAVSCCGSTG